MDPDLSRPGPLRPLTRTDRDRLINLLHATGVFTREEIDIARELIDVVLDQPHQQDYVVTVFEEEGRVAGYYCLGPTPGTDGTFDLYWIAVDPALQGKGLGAMLDRHAEAYVRSRHGRLIIAETSSTSRYDRTRAFYAHRGYTEVSRIRDYYRPGDDLVVFGKYFV